MSRKQIALVIVLLLALYLVLAYGIYASVTQHVQGANDFFSRWAGAGALVLRGANPYSDTVTREIQMGMYGRLARPDEDQVAFAYPLYTAFVVAPLVVLPYAQAQAAWMAFLVLAVVGQVVLLSQLNHLRLRPNGLVVLLLGALVFYPVVRGIFLGQMALAAFLFLALALWAIETRRDSYAGIFLALATIKPQIALFVVPALMIWSAAQRRWRIVGAAAGGLVALVLFAMLWVPSWPFDFIRAMRQYAEYEPVGPPVQTISEWLIPGNFSFGIAIILGLGLVGWMVWRAAVSLTVNWREFQSVMNIAVVVTTLTGGRVGTPDQILLLIPWLHWLSMWWEKRQKIRVVLAGAILLILPWLFFLMTLRGDAEDVRVTLLLPFLTLAVLIVQEITRARAVIGVEYS